MSDQFFWGAMFGIFVVPILRFALEKLMAWTDDDVHTVTSD